MEIMKVGRDQKKKAAAVVASAFLQYPMFAHYFPDPEKRKRWMPWYMERTLNCALRYGEVFAPADLSGVMFLLPPGHTRLTQGEYIRNGFLLLPLIMGFGNYRNNDICDTYIADTHERLMQGRSHYYLWGLVADPKAQRKGIGSALLNILTAKADAEGMPVYLETHDPNNVAYYERFGFGLVYTGNIPGQDATIWCMVREAGN